MTGFRPVDTPTCEFCGALMVPVGYKCLSCRAVPSPAPAPDPDRFLVDMPRGELCDEMCYTFNDEQREIIFTFAKAYAEAALRSREAELASLRQQLADEKQSHKETSELWQATTEDFTRAERQLAELVKERAENARLRSALEQVREAWATREVSYEREVVELQFGPGEQIEDALYREGK